METIVSNNKCRCLFQCVIMMKGLETNLANAESVVTRDNPQLQAMPLLEIPPLHEGKVLITTYFIEGELMK